MTAPVRLAAPEQSDELMLVLAFSGGGIRASALSYGVLEALAQVEVPEHGNQVGASDATQRHSLLDEVDLISSVSGGSFTAAYYALYGDRIFDDFEERFLCRNVSRDLILRTLWPINWFRLASPGFGRSDLAAEYYDRLLFDGATFGDLRNKGTPGIFIQATDIVDGIYFGFIPYYFSLLCSDLNDFPISRAVAASAALPGPFDSITLRNYAGTCGFVKDPWMNEALEKRDVTSRLFHAASHLSSYLDSEKKAFVHLVDGGVADNLALRGPLEMILARGGMRETLEDLGLRRPRRIAFIIVNAEKQVHTVWGLSSQGPGIFGIINVAYSVMLNSYNYETVELLRRYIQEWSVENGRQREDASPVEFYATEVTFNALHSEEERRYFSRIPTSFNLSRKDMDELREVARRILYESESFQKLVSDLGGEIPQPEPRDSGRQ